MQLTQSFKTAEGYCHILLDKIVLSPHENTYEPVEEKSFYKILIPVFFIAFCLLLGSSYKAFENNEYYWAVICLFAGFYFGRRCFALYNNSNSSIIERDAILKVEYFAAIYGVQAPKFHVTYKKPNEAQKVKTIYLGNRYTNDKNNAEIQHAIDIMDEEFG